MAMDYRERKAVSKNRPRRQPAGIFFFSIFVAVIIAYTLGLVTGWLVFRSGQQTSADVSTSPAGAVKGGAEDPPAASGETAPENTGKIKEPMLTFYETLPKGNRELIGSGLNSPSNILPPPVAKAVPPPSPPQKPAPAVKEVSPAAKEVSPAAKEVSPAETAQPAKEKARVPVKKPEANGTMEQSAGEPAAKKEEEKGQYVVQVASYNVKKEAEEMRNRLRAGGLAAYILETYLPDKGIFYRVRIGRHLNQKQAREMAERAGSGSIVIHE